MRSLARTWRTARLDLDHNLRRPLFWIWMLIAVLVSWGMSTGNMRISSGDSNVGGVKAYITSEFAVAQVVTVLVLLLHGMFVAIGAGMTVLRDEELRVGPLLHATPLGPREYIWGKFLAALASFVVLFAAHIGWMVLFNHLTTGAEDAEFIGPFLARNYWRPALVLGLPTIVFLAGGCFWVGERFRRPILVFFLPVALLLVCGFLLWDWSPSWLAEGWNRALMLVDPAGNRWLKETYLNVDRGVAFYNEAPIAFDRGFLVSRAVYLALGLAAPALAARHFAANLRGARSRAGARVAPSDAPAPREAAPRLEPASLKALGMRSRRPGLAGGTLSVARIEFQELASSPGLYLFLPLIVLETVGNTTLMQGAFDTRVLLTSGVMAVSGLGWLSTLVCLLLLFYTVESLRREEATGLASLHHATPLRTFSLLLGKALANSLVGVVVVGVTLVACAVVLAVQGKAAFELGPFALVWGALLLPTFLLWSSFVALLYSLVRSRYTTYALALGAYVWTVYKDLTGKLTWVWNWLLSRTLRWSDMGTFELVRGELFLNRALALAMTLLFTVLTVRLFPRRQTDPTNALLRLRPRPLLVGALRISPLIVLPIALAIVLQGRIDDGFQGDAAKKAQKDYWRRNVATWTNGLWPDVAGVDMSLDLFPETQGFEAKGTLRLVNREAKPLSIVPLTHHRSWRRPASLPPVAEGDGEGPLWSSSDHPFEAEDAAGLVLLRLAEPLAPDQEMTLDFHYSGTVPGGATKNGGGAGEFILPSGVVLTSFSASFVPIVGYLEQVGVDEDNEYDAKEYPDDFHEGVTRSAFGGSAPFPVRLRVSVPEGYDVHGVGVRQEDSVANGRRTCVWEADAPVRFFNVVAGRWAVAEGRHGTAIHYHPEHTANIPAMVEALDGARVHFSEWFYPYPWRELRISEFPALAGYAQGFPTNITFSEGIGFLTRAEESDADAPFMVTAHETAHQWWGNILTPGRGPGGDLLSEGMAHFSTLLLFEEMRGLRGRIAFARQIEDQYGEKRQADSERALVRIDGSRPGDVTVTYDKAGWVFWMLLQHMGRESCLAGLRSFIGHYAADRDHPVLQDFLAHLRPFAPDALAYDAFTRQWFHEVVVPEYRLADVARTEVDGAWRVQARLTNVGTGEMPVEVAASAGQRFPDDAPEASAAPPVDDGSLRAASGGADYREARARALLGPGESAAIDILCDFVPERVVVDPDALVLQLRRKQAVHEF